MAMRNSQHGAINFTKELYMDDPGAKKIKSMRFSTMSSEEIAKTSEVHVYEQSLYRMPERSPALSGVLDRRLGTSHKGKQCETCNGNMSECPGHFGHIKLELPVFHLGFFKDILSILQCVCKTCARILLREEDRIKWLKRMRNPRKDVMQKKAFIKAIVVACKKIKTCSRCGEPNGVVKKLGSTLKIVHDKYKQQEAFQEMTKNLGALMQDKEKSRYVKNIMEELHPTKVLGIFKRLTDEDCEVLDLVDRPEQLIVSHLAVPPIAIRPSVEIEGGSNEDDITIKLIQLVEQNNKLGHCLRSGVPPSGCAEIWDFLQIQVALYINSELSGVPLAAQPVGKPLRGFTQRLKGKQGRFRGNLSGKRVNFTGRTVISPDPNLRVTELGVPILMAMTLTYPERVTEHNIGKLRQRIINGRERYPGANFIRTRGGHTLALKWVNRKQKAGELNIGDVVERHLEDGDIVLFNRQPSLHRLSIMCHRARVMPGRTLRFNESVCNPYNADFDGDEMNIHVPQTEEARAEALALMGVQENLCTPKNGDILVAATQDFLTSAFLITRKDTFYRRDGFCKMCVYFYDASVDIDLPTPAILKPVELWTGKQLFSVLLRPNANVRIFLNLTLTEKNHVKGTETMCPRDGYVYFRNSELLCGQLAKASLGNGSKDGVFSALLRDYGSQAAVACINRLSKLSARYIGDRGFSFGLHDVRPGDMLVREIEKQVNQGYQACDKHINLYNKGQLPPETGCDAAASLESKCASELNKIREAAGEACVSGLHWRNSPLIMSQAGSKGSVINTSQMIACVGQQSIGGRRIPDGFLGRSLPHFRRNDKKPQARGFVSNSFYSGLTATEFYFHTMGGREGLVDTAVKTADTGYMARRLMKAMEDLTLTYDGTVRNAGGNIVQFTYGDDGMDPAKMEGRNGTPLNLHRLFLKAKATCPPDQQQSISPDQICKELNSRLTEEDANACQPAFIESLRKFVEKEAANIGATKALMKPFEASEMMNYLTSRQLKVFLDICIRRYNTKKQELGTAVGPIGAQSIAEPGTQMTLKTFHFAGVASMNITMGVPRIKEIINATKAISTPIITAKLNLEFNDQHAANIVKDRIEKTMLKDVAKIVIKQALRPFISVEFDKIAQWKQLSIYGIAGSILKSPKIKKSIKLKPEHITVRDAEQLIIYSPVEGNSTMLLFSLQHLHSLLSNVVVKGISSVERAVVQKDHENYKLLVEGTNLAAVMGTEGVDGNETLSNNIFEVLTTLGIEAARRTIIDQIKYTMDSHKMDIDTRHVSMLADDMTNYGEVLGITRFGLAKMKESTLMLASFEKTTDHLFNAAAHGTVDKIQGISESIIMGIPIPAGTGLFRLKQEKYIPPLDYGPTPLLDE